MTSPYRKYDHEGRPVGFDWRALALRTLLWCVVGAAVAFGGACGYSCGYQDKPCRDTVLDTSLAFDAECEHSDHRLVHAKGDWACLCGRDTLAVTAPSASSRARGQP